MVTLDQGGAGRTHGSFSNEPVPGNEAIEAAWTLRVPAGGASRAWRVVPDLSPHLIVHRMPSGKVRAVVVGARSTWLDVDQGARAYSVGVRLAPGTLPLLIGDDAERLLDRGAHVADAFGARGASLQRRLEDATSPEATLGAVLHFLGERLTVARAVDWRVRGYVRQLWRSTRVGPKEAASTLGVSTRGLRATCSTEIGLSPKAVQRIVRLHRALGAMLGPRGVSGSEAAGAAGYADQPHFVRDARALLGEPPTDFLARRHAGSFKREDGVAT